MNKPVRCLRYALQGISLFLFVFLMVTLFYPLGWQATLLEWFSRLDPWALFSYLRWQHSLPTWGWLPLLTLAITLLLGRVFCGWLCPFGALLMLSDKASRIIFKNKRAFKKITLFRTKILHWLQPMRSFWLLFLAVIFVLGSNWVLFFTPFALFSHELVKILQGTVPWVLIGIIAGTLIFSRLWCSVLCPTGILLSVLARLRLFRYQVAGNCVQCAKCTASCSVGAAPAATGVAKEGCLACGDCQRVCPTKAVHWLPIYYGRSKNKTEIASGMTGVKNKHSRRQFFKIASTIVAAAVLWEKTVGAAKKVLRPPGALQETEFTAVCNRCGRCIKACSNNALQPMPVTEGFECWETPYIIPRQANCVLCFTCREVCPTGAIAQVPLEQVKMGAAELDKQRCIAWNENKLCVICGEQCPVQAIEIDDQLKPIVYSDKCVGCGTCEKACPVDGEAAITVLPK